MCHIVLFYLVNSIICKNKNNKLDIIQVIKLCALIDFHFVTIENFFVT